MNLFSNSASSGTSEPCREHSQQMYLLVADELERPEQTEAEAHAQSCEACAKFLAEYHQLAEALFAFQPENLSAELLTSCRRSLSNELDDLEAEVAESQHGIQRWRWLRGVLPFSLTIQPVAAGLLLFLGFTIGIFVPHWVGPQSEPNPALNANDTPDVPVEPAGPATLLGLNAQDLRTANITGINWEPTSDTGQPEVQVQLQAQRPLTVQGTVANNNVKDTLLYILQNNRRCGPDVRIESVELLKPRSNDSDVRQTLCKVIRTDGNAAVRLKALETLNGEGDPLIVRQTLEDVLVADTNPGVRIEAINALRAMAVKNQMPLDPQLVKVLRERAESDSSTYIRLQSAALIQDLGPKQSY
jgi:anti-sigma factor RsiW